jgi:hydroxyacylglutathione hydrolase
LGWLARESLLIAEDHSRLELEEAHERLARWHREGRGSLYGGLAGRTRARLPVEQTGQISVGNFNDMMAKDSRDLQVIDVRRAPEWPAGHIEQAWLKPPNRLKSLINDIDVSKPIAFHCMSGYRSSTAASMLPAAEFKDVMNVIGGFDAWTACKLSVARPDAAQHG